LHSTINSGHYKNLTPLNMDNMLYASFMAEIEPWKPYEADVTYPTRLASGEIALLAQRSSIFGVHTAGLAIDDAPLDTPFPFEQPVPDDNLFLRSRYLGFVIVRSGDTYHIPDSCRLYGELAAQMLGALYAEGDCEEAVYHDFYFTEEVVGEAVVGDYVHDDSDTNTPDQRVALVSNIFPTHYLMQSLNRYVKGNRRLAGIDYEDAPSDLWWCAKPREITVHQGQTAHARPPFPKGLQLARKSAQLRIIGDNARSYSVNRVEIDDVILTDSDAQSLLTTSCDRSAA
jgi:hypothetical protein